MALRFNKWFLCSCLAVIFGFLKSLIFRKSNKEKLDLPITKRQGPDGQESTEPEEELQNWETWDDDGSGFTEVRIDSTEQSQQEEENEPDFFADMTPSFKKAALIRKKSAKSAARYPSPSSGGSSMSYSLGVDDTATLSGELGTWTEAAGGWEDEAEEEDLGLDAENLLKEKREAERRRRVAEQQRKKAEREAQRNSQRGSSKLAVKLS